MLFDFKNIIPETITADYILKRISEEDIINFVTDSVIEYKRYIKSPFRNENNPSFTFKKCEDGKIIWRDWGTGENGDCFTLVMKKYNCNYHEALNIIYVNLLNDSKHNCIDVKKELDFRIKESKLEKEVNKIKVLEKGFNLIDFNYWGKYGIDLSTLLLFNVAACKRAFIQYGDQWRIIGEYTNDRPLYSYKFLSGNYKIYSPKNKREWKWRTNTTIDDIQGIEMLPPTGEVVIITKSLKDVMCLYKMGLPAISLQSEILMLDEILHKNLATRFKNIVLLYDNDEQGYRGSKNIIENYSNIRRFFVPLHTESKDVSELILTIGFINAEETIKTLLNETISQTNNTKLS